MCSLVGGWESVQMEHLISRLCLDPAEIDCSSHLICRFYMHLKWPLVIGFLLPCSHLILSGGKNATADKQNYTFAVSPSSLRRE